MSWACIVWSWLRRFVSERLPGDVYAKLDSRDSVASRVWDRWCRALVGRPSSLQVGADALGKVVCGAMLRVRRQRCVRKRAGRSPLVMVVLRGQARRTFRDPAKSSNFGSVTSLPGELSTKMPAQGLASRACSAEVVQLVSLLAAFRQPCYRCRVLPLRTCLACL
eukprot:scaffold18042_cov65-Phaeocystis_antarctica.AAC.2